ncbi:hypothetical protein BDF21DRAFT_14559 [Thamnidium elegans]|nr:hypothetical protein BDF21DRAFT_14559 [Thamnidium elegans]
MERRIFSFFCEKKKNIKVFLKKYQVLFFFEVSALNFLNAFIKSLKSCSSFQILFFFVLAIVRTTHFSFFFISRRRSGSIMLVLVSVYPTGMKFSTDVIIDLTTKKKGGGFVWETTVSIFKSHANK